MLRSQATYDYAIIRRNTATGLSEHTFGGGNLASIPAGSGLAFHTYEGDEFAPAFVGGPYAVPIEVDAASTLGSFSGTLDNEHLVGVAVKTIDLQTGWVDYQIRNTLGTEE